MENNAKYYFVYFTIKEEGLEIADGHTIVSSSLNPSEILSEVQDDIRDQAIKNGFNKDSIRITIKQFNSL